jgi:NADH:ubiquinone oxidoreductase subunit 3 (subunit A)
MDEYNTGMDPEVKRYFRKIMKTFSVGLLWMMVTGTAGFFFGLAIIRDGLRWYNLVFYFFFLLTLAAMIFYFYKIWGKND